MAEMRTIRLKTEIDEDKVKAVKEALERFEICQQEMRQAISGVQQAVYDMNDAISVKPVSDG